MTPPMLGPALPAIARAGERRHRQHFLDRAGCTAIGLYLVAQGSHGGIQPDAGRWSKRAASHPGARRQSGLDLDGRRNGLRHACRAAKAARRRAGHLPPSLLDRMGSPSRDRGGGWRLLASRRCRPSVRRQATLDRRWRLAITDYSSSTSCAAAASGHCCGSASCDRNRRCMRAPRPRLGPGRRAAGKCAVDEPADAV